MAIQIFLTLLNIDVLLFDAIQRWEIKFKTTLTFVFLFLRHVEVGMIEVHIARSYLQYDILTGIDSLFRKIPIAHNMVVDT